MKTIPIVLILLLTGLEVWAQKPGPTNPPVLRRSIPPAAVPPAAPVRPAARPAMPAMPNLPAARPPATPPRMPAMPESSATAPESGKEKEVPGYTYNFPGVDVDQVLDVYATLIGRTQLRASGLPNVSITLKTESPLTKSEAIEALQAVLAMNGISVINFGDKFVKVVPSAQANTEGGTLDFSSATNLPELGTYVTRIVQLKYIRPTEVAPILQQFAKLPNSIYPIDSNGILIIRDYAENVKRMLEMLEQVDINVPAVYVSAVIPIRYALASDIANALNSLGGQGSATVSFGASSATTPVSGFSSPHTGGMGAGGMGAGGLGAGNTGFNQPGGNTPFGRSSTFGTQANNPNGMARPGATPIQQRLLNIINRASSPTAGGGQEASIQVFGQAKIIADERSNSLLVFATKDDMERIKEVVNQLDVLLPQVLIESAIIDYSLGPDSLKFGVSAAQNPQTYTSNPQTVGAGGFNNGQSFLSFLNGSVSGLTNATSVFGNSLPGGLSYFGNIGPKWDVALAAAAADSHATIVQRPSIMTSQAKSADFFVGNTVPYITGYGNYGYGNQSTYSQLSVGVELNVTPYINPDGLVDMIIQQEIDALNGFTTIASVGDVPNTIKRTLTSEIAVKDRDTIMLGGFIENDKSSSRSGVPLLMDIPLLGNLFTSRSDSKKREELVVLLRPTVLKTPEIAAAQTVAEERRLPGVSAAEAEDAAQQHKAIEAEQKRLRRESGRRGRANGFFPSPVPANPAPSQTPPAGSENSYPPTPTTEGLIFTNNLIVPAR
jgi:general secretion pathway protein D